MKKLLENFQASKWSSRKFLATVFTLILITLNEVIGLNIDPAIYWQIVGAVSVYVLGESIVDAKREEGKKEE